MGSKRQREIRGGETYSAAMILSRIGYDIALHFLKPTAMVLRQSLHPSRASTIRQPERVEVQPEVALSEFIDVFGNRCSGHDLRTAPYMVEGGCHMSRWTATRIATHTTSLLR